MNDKNQDPNLQSPQEANTTKHINFRETEEADANSSNTNNSSSTNEESPTKKAWEEMRKENRANKEEAD